jgi:hypothetical protein
MGYKWERKGSEAPAVVRLDALANCRSSLVTSSSGLPSTLAVEVGAGAGGFDHARLARDG